MLAQLAIHLGENKCKPVSLTIYKISFMLTTELNFKKIKKQEKWEENLRKHLLGRAFKNRFTDSTT